MVRENRYTSNGTVFYKDDGSWAVQINYHFGGGGAPFKVIKWATWYNEHMPLLLQETNEAPEMYGWKVAAEADVILYCKNQGIIERLNKIKSLVNFGYTGKFSTPENLLAEIEWRMSV